MRTFENLVKFLNCVNIINYFYKYGINMVEAGVLVNVALTFDRKEVCGIKNCRIN